MKENLKLKYLGVGCKEQITFGSHTNPNDILVEGNYYDVERVEVHRWHTKIILKGIKGKFNSVWFEDFEPDEQDMIDFWDRKEF